ncbi:unnamed protein product [Candidula unifasciata]|uniref:Uncharacterized protein n=1 Tax=Candidula unifasciata TaxID=100452 RepID=A0A8S3YHK2_9EUPU|nr:unnamed protein product [Candidula unifasciata]
MSQSSDSTSAGTASTASLPIGRQKTVGLHQGAKSLIRNVIRHTDTHNRLLEESEMWQTYYRLKREKPDESDNKGNAFRDPDVKNSFLYDDRKDMRWERSYRRGLKQAHMDEIAENRQTDIGSSNSTFWMRQLQKVEDNDPERWGHAGFKELYPDAFDSDRSAKNDDAQKKKSLKKTHTRREHKHRSSDRKRRRKRPESDRVRKKEKRPRKHKDDSSRDKKNKKRRYSHDSDTDSSTDVAEKDRKSKKRRNSTETSESDSETEEESKRKKSRRNMKTESEREKKKSRESAAHRSHRQRKRRKH